MILFNLCSNWHAIVPIAYMGKVRMKHEIIRFNEQSEAQRLPGRLYRIAYLELWHVEWD